MNGGLKEDKWNNKTKNNQQVIFKSILLNNKKYILYFI